MRSCVLLYFVFLAYALCHPATRDGSPSRMMGLPTVEALNFMKRFGYIEDGGDDSAALYTEEGLEDVIKTVQKFGALNQTGKLDSETIKLMKTPRCGVPDILRNDEKRQKRYILGPGGWNKRNISFFVANWPSTLKENEVSKNIMLALDTWGRYGRLTFTKVNDPSADIIVAFGSGYHGDRYPFDGPGNILAHAYFPYEQDSYGGDIHFDADENWTTNSEDLDGIDFLTVAIHELGHSLGLSHSHIPTSVMFPYYFSHGRITLDYDDILAMYELYIKRKLDGDDDFQVQYPKPETTTEEYFYSEDYTTKRPEVTTTSTRRPTTKKSVQYEGDFENVDVHKEHDETHGVPSTNSPSLPDVCQGHYDAVAAIRNEIFIFKDEYIWRLRREYDLIPGYPIPIHQMFPKFPKNIKKVDAAYERQDGMIVLFTGKNYWVYDGTHFVENSPISIRKYGFSDRDGGIDAVQVWAKNGKTYFYKGDQFWRYNETAKAMDAGYPKHMERWRGVPLHIDAATTWKGITYFFKGKCYWKFDNDWIIVTEQSPLPTPQVWLGCPKEESEAC